MGKRIGVLGVAFKPNTDDTRDSAALDIISILLEEGSEVTAYDPIVGESTHKILPDCVAITSNYLEAIQDCEALIICTEWQEIINIDWIEVTKHMREPKIILDGRNCLSKNLLTELGFKYFGIGR